MNHAVRDNTSGNGNIATQKESLPEVVADDSDAESECYEGCSAEALHSILLLQDFYSKYGPESPYSLETVLRVYNDNFSQLSEEIRKEIDEFAGAKRAGTTFDMTMAEYLWELMNFSRTMEVYNEIFRLEKSASIRHLISEEYSKWNKMADVVNDIAHQVVDLFYCGGTMRLIASSVGDNLCAEARYENVLLLKQILTESPYEDTKAKWIIPPEAACRTLLTTAGVQLQNEYQPEDYADSVEGYKDSYEKGMKRLTQLEQPIQNWIKVRMEISKSIDHDTEKPYRDHSSMLLFELSSIIAP